MCALVACGDPESDRSCPVDAALRDAVPADACVKGASRCGEGLEVCSSGAWHAVGECPTGTACLGGNCLPAACVGDCDGRECGCNGLCGVCQEGWVCGDEGRCGLPGSRCGDGECLADETCEGCPADCCEDPCAACPETATCEDGVCVMACTPDCTGRNCGDDGCGAVCGECAVDEVCEAGRCAAAPPVCGDHVCEDDENCRDCEADCGVCCGNGLCQAELDETCVTCAVDCVCAPNQRCRVDHNRCVVVCEPQCAGLECGEDGCGGSCGTCEAPVVCDDGHCD